MMDIFINILFTLPGMLDIDTRQDYPGRRQNFIFNSIGIVSLMNGSVEFFGMFGMFGLR